MFTEKSPKIAEKIVCEKCHYKCCKQSDWNKHLSTRKHKNVYPSLSKVAEVADKKYECQCGKEYKHKQSLYVHRKGCEFNNNDGSDIKQLTSAILQIVSENVEFRKMMQEQNKQLIELSKTHIGNNNNNNNINSNNKVNNKFNINMFLNEKCKDALNISDFVSQLNIGIKDLEETGRLGFADGISKIFIN
jgi:hypothetical protein